MNRLLVNELTAGIISLQDVLPLPLIAPWRALRDNCERAEDWLGEPVLSLNDTGWSSTQRAVLAQVRAYAGSQR